MTANEANERDRRDEETALMAWDAVVALLPHPATATLLAKYGNTAAGRAKARQALEAAMVAAARREASEAGRSMRCEQGNHARVDPEYFHVGCRNDGSTCICECHDPKEADDGR